MHEEIKDLTLDQVQAWDAQTFPELIEQLERLPEKAYVDAAYFEAGNTFEHYPAHTPALRGLIAAKEGEHTPCIESGNKRLDRIAGVFATGNLFRYREDGGGECQRFETRYAQRLGVRHCFMTASGTNSLTAALMGAGIGPGDEVIVPGVHLHGHARIGPRRRRNPGDRGHRREHRNEPRRIARRHRTAHPCSHPGPHVGPAV